MVITTEKALEIAERVRFAKRVGACLAVGGAKKAPADTAGALKRIIKAICRSLRMLWGIQGVFVLLFRLQKEVVHPFPRHLVA